MMTISVMIKEP